MANPYLPHWEYIPDGEPRVFGDRVYIYGSHDTAGSYSFCDTKLMVWSASVDDLNNWQCHGDIFRTTDSADRKADTDWTSGKLFAPDVVEKDGKYYLYAYIQESKGCVAVSDKPEGPFTLLSQYKYPMPDNTEGFDSGIFIDPGVLVDDDGRAYIYCGFLSSYMAELNPDNMYEILDGSFQTDIIPKGNEPWQFFEACSPRKVGDTYYMIYSPMHCSNLAYATSDSPKGPFTFRGNIIDSGDNYPGGNNHGSICCIKGQWYIFYHRMTNNSIFSRRGCVEKIEILPDGTIPQVEATSLGFEDSLNPYKQTPADIACVLTEGAYIIERNEFERCITGIKSGTVMGYKYYDFGEDFSSKTMQFAAKVKGYGAPCKIKIVLDDFKDGKQIGECTIGLNDGVYKATIENVTGRHAVYLIAESLANGWDCERFHNRTMMELESFVFMKQIDIYVRMCYDVLCVINLTNIS